MSDAAYNLLGGLRMGQSYPMEETNLVKKQASGGQDIDAKYSDTMARFLAVREAFSQACQNLE